MRRNRLFTLLIVPVLASGLLAGCATGNKSVFEGGTSITATVQNPIGRKELAEVELSYTAASKAFVACRRVHCVSAVYLRAYQGYDNRAYAALVAARRAVRENPTVSGLSAVVAARQAISDFNTTLRGS